MTTKDIVYIALFAALMAVLGVFPPITIPFAGVPVTAQSLGPMLAASILGAKRGGLAVLLFAVLVALGLPLLSGGRGGFGVYFGVTGGFIVGWVVGAFVTGLLIEKFWHNLNVLTAAISIVIGGVIVDYAIGNIWVTKIAGISYWQATVGSAPFLIGDAVKVIIATVVCLAVKKSYPLMKKSS